jgi:hypothetical protein
MTLDGRHRGGFVAVLVLMAFLVARISVDHRGAFLSQALLPFVLVFGIMWALAPTALAIEGGTLRIRRHAGTALEVPVTTISGVELVPRPGFSVRLWGGQGFFGSHGVFWTRAYGRARLYMTRGGTGVLLRRRGGDLPIFVTPDDPERFAASIRAASGIAEDPAPR